MSVRDSESILIFGVKEFDFLQTIRLFLRIKDKDKTFRGHRREGAYRLMSYMISFMEKQSSSGQYRLGINLKAADIFSLFQMLRENNAVDGGFFRQINDQFLILLS